MNFNWAIVYRFRLLHAIFFRFEIWDMWEFVEYTIPLFTMWILGFFLIIRISLSIYVSFMDIDDLRFDLFFITFEKKKLFTIPIFPCDEYYLKILKQFSEAIWKI